MLDGKKISAKDSIEIIGVNTYFEIELRKGEKKYTLYPRAQINPAMGGLLASPDIHRTATEDIYTHVSSVMSPDEEVEWSKLTEDTLRIGEEFFANDYVCVIQSIERIAEVDGVTLNSQDVAVKAKIKVSGEHGDYFAEPIFLIKDKMAGRIADEINDLGLKFTLINIHPETNAFVLGINTRQKDWVVIKALEKPFINVLWIGTLVLMVGFIVAMIRRIREFRLMKGKGLE
jgi:cytochrome c-type biogenesis protein CcmF